MAYCSIGPRGRLRPGVDATARRKETGSLHAVDARRSDGSDGVEACPGRLDATPPQATQLSPGPAASPSPLPALPLPSCPPNRLPRSPQQTGSGKTYTMGAASVAGWAPEQIGVIPRAVEQLFNALEACGPQEEWSLRVSFLEIHNEEVQGPPSP